MAFEDLEARLNDIGHSGDAGADDTDTGGTGDTDVDVNDDVNVNDNDTSDDSVDNNDDSSSADTEGSMGGETDKPKRLSILEKITGILNGKKETTEDSADADDDVNADQKDEDSKKGAGDTNQTDGSDNQDNNNAAAEPFVDPRFMVVAREYGWTDAQIVDYSSKNDASEVVKLANHMEDALGVDEGSEDGTKTDTDLVSEDLLAKLAEDEDNAPIINDVVKPLLAQVQQLSKALEGVQANQNSQDEATTRNGQKQDFDFANDEFDRHTKEFTELGVTANLRRLPGGGMDTADPAVQRRSEVFDKASQHRAANPNATWKECVDEGMIYYRGKYGADAMEKRILSKLEKSSKKVSPRTRGVSRTQKFTDPRERKRAVINAALEKHNKTMR